MKAQELMIGDWVMLKDDPNFCFQMEDISGTSMFKRWTKDGEYMIPYCYEEIEPIPLTPEILEKNGFAKGRRKEGLATEYSWVEDIYVYPQTIVIYTIYDRPIGGINSLLRCVSPSKAGSGQNEVHICEVGSVHELQHALRLCGIEKEVIL